MTTNDPVVTLEPCLFHDDAKLPPAAGGYLMGTAAELQMDEVETND